MYPYVSAECVIHDGNVQCDAVVSSVDKNKQTFSVEYTSPETGKLSEMTDITFENFRLILYYVGLGWVKKTYVYKWVNAGEGLITNDGTERKWEDVKNGVTNLYLNKQTANKVVAGSFMSKMV